MSLAVHHHGDHVDWSYQRHQKIKKLFYYVSAWSYFINQLMECKTNDPNFTSLNEEGTLSANKMKSLSFFIQTVIFFWHLNVHCTVSHTDAQYIFRLIIWLQKKFPIKVCWRPINAHKFCNPRWNLL